MMRRTDRGSVTAELAVALPSLMLLLMFGITGVAGTMVKLRCCAAARDAALAQARGDSAEAAARLAAPDNATVTRRTDGGVVRVTIRAPVKPFGPRLPGLVVEGSAAAAVEPPT
ncbi:MAG: mucin-associated surface protein [Dactylosporangium sp.]|nr:pilus assembly protein [Dactylosporangium sp.]NNJ63026.1 mucin-associated surface protein [Dactylosporangium sp.]